MYLREKLIKGLSIRNIIGRVIGWFLMAASSYVLISNFVYYRDDIETAMRARSTPESIRCLIVAAIILLIVEISRYLIQEARLYSGFFECDLDGYIKYKDLCEVTGRSEAATRRYLMLLKKLYMKDFVLQEKDGEEQVVLASKTIVCLCANCGAELEKRSYFTGKCSYCGSSDLNAKIISNERFYSIQTDVSEKKKNPEYYITPRINNKFTSCVVFMALSMAISLINVAYSIDCFVHHNDKAYIDAKIRRHGWYGNYEVLSKRLVNDSLFGMVFSIFFIVIMLVMISKLIRINTARKCSGFFAVGDKPFYTATAMGKVVRGKNPFKRIKSTLRAGYLKNCTFERHNGNTQIALAKQVIKDRCPSCGAPIIGAVTTNYQCQYCNNLIMGVVTKK